MQTMMIQNLGGAGYVIVNEEDKFHSAYGFNKWTSVEENARIYESMEQAMAAIDRMAK